MALGCFDRRPLEIHFCRAEQFSLDGELLDFFFFLRPCHRSEVGVGPSFPQSHSGLFVFLIGSFFLFFFLPDDRNPFVAYFVLCVSWNQRDTFCIDLSTIADSTSWASSPFGQKKKAKKATPTLFFYTANMMEHFYGKFIVKETIL